ncbi:glycosyltransferase [Vibrio sp. B181a]|uniref:glycosyltransferase n=1 Tax=Vibrio sp. B181a TaxID=2835906 RepID=UPI002552E9C9|nr:glycosyltransferase [Vibrio sp. B181a]MDK9773408.1 glycosyltransferase [Vibrio sp. B181a]
MTFIDKKQMITVAVITYNSSGTVIETLDSILEQSYGPENIELIISDDSSIDDTVIVIRRWLHINEKKFHSVKLFLNKINQGISKNCNVAWRAASCQWIKTIAGDDILYPNCILDNVEYIDVNKNVAAVFSRMNYFRVDNSGLKEKICILPKESECYFFELTAKMQFKYLQRWGVCGAPSAFLNLAVLRDIGYADERFPMMEDHPLWFKLTMKGYRLSLLDKVTVGYRSSESVSFSQSKLISESFIKQMMRVDELLIIPVLSKGQIMLKYRKLLWPRLVLIVSRLFSNKVSFFSRSLLFIALLFKPGYVTKKLKDYIRL